MQTPDEWEGLYGLEVRDEDATRPPIESEPCIVCQGRRVRVRYSGESLPGVVVECETCGQGWLEPMPGREEIAGFYSTAYYGEPGNKFRPIVEELVRWVGARQIAFLSHELRVGDRVLDVGCGRGVSVGPLADQGFEVHGVEVSEDAVRGADSRANIRIAPSLADAGYSDAFFRQVVIWHVLEHLPDPRETLVEVRRVLAPGGRLVVSVPNFSSLQSRWLGSAWFHLDLPRHLYHFPVGALRRLLEDTGFEVVSEHHFSLRQNPFGWIQSGLNRTKLLPRNSLYRLLHDRGRGQGPPYSRGLRLLLYTLFFVSSPVALGLSVVAALFRQGATIHFIAKRREDGT